MKKKWKITLIISLLFNLLLLVGGAYIIIANTVTSGHNYDNLITITEDLNNISKAISKKAFTIDQFDKELDLIQANHWTDKNNSLISFQIVNILFEENGDFKKIETYYLND